MGPPKKSVVAPPPSTSAPRRCILCRRNALTAAAQQRMNAKLKSCAISLCTIFGLPDNHPFKIIYERAQYCESCLKEVQEADLTLGKLDLMKQSLLRFQNRVYSKLGDNYFQIDNREDLNASFVDFEAGGAAMKGRKFSYDEIVKIIYEKLDRDCLKWERFSSEGKVDTGTETKDMFTQTEIVFLDESSALPSQATQISFTVNDTPQVVIPDVIEEEVAVWDGDDNGAADDDFAGGSEFEVSTTKSYRSKTDPLAGIVFDSSIEIDYGPEAAGLPFAKVPINFEEKIYCTFDPENCKRFFYDEYNLKVHIKSFHEGNPLPHQCTVCMKEFVDEGRLKNHFVRLHAKSEAFMCDQCGKGFPHPVILREHVRKKHMNNKEAFACSFCAAPFGSASDLETHENLHRAKEEPFACVFCPDTFPNSTVLKNHFSTCHSDNRFPCPHCGKILATEQSLKVHMNLHTTTFKCDKCEFAGTSKTSLKQHLLTHTEEKAFKCEECGHAFKYAKNLSGHMRIHTGEKPYSCSLCGQSFRELSYLRRHEESHSSTINYSCETCGAGFKVKENLKKHQRTHKEGYVPKKKPYTPRTEEQKEQRRLKREQQRREGILSPLKRPRSSIPIPKRKLEKSTPGRKPQERPTKTVVIKAEPKPISRKRQRSSPARSPAKRKVAKKTEKKQRRGGKQIQKECSSEEEYSEDDDYPVEEQEEEDEDEAEEQKVDYSALTQNHGQDEVANAVASISTVDTNAIFSNNVVYANHFQTQPGQATFIPVTVVNTQGVKSASQLVVRTRNQQQQPQHQVMQYQFL